MKKISDEIYYADEKIIRINANDIVDLKKKALQSKIRRTRVCLHENQDSIVQEMFIVHFADTYVRPHKHIGKPESIYIIEGAADIIVFNPEGEIVDVVVMGEFSSGKMFYYRIPEQIFHSVMITSDVCVFYETTKGPFNKERDTVLPSWSPDNDDTVNVKKYMKDLHQRKEAFLSRSKG